MEEITDAGQIGVSFSNLIGDDKKLTELNGYQFTPEWMRQRLDELAIDHVDLLMLEGHENYSFKCLSGRIIWSTAAKLPHNAYGTEIRKSALYVPWTGRQSQDYFFRLISKKIQTKDGVSLERVGMIDLHDLWLMAALSDAPFPIATHANVKVMINMGLAETDHGVLTSLILFKVRGEDMLKKFLDSSVRDDYLTKVMRTIFEKNPHVDISISLWYEWSREAYVRGVIKRLGEMREEALQNQSKN